MASFDPLIARIRAVTRPAVPMVAAVGKKTHRVVRPVTKFGWSMLIASALSWLVGARFGWIEFLYFATLGVILFAACVLLTIGRTRLSVEVLVDPRRVTVGTGSAGQVNLVNTARGVLLPIELELAVGDGTAHFRLPLLRPGVSYDELFVIPTDHRGVIPVGPARTVRGDPLGVMRRSVDWTEVIELFVHPRVVPLEPLGAGLLRDLEGTTTNEVSMSDLAFHALREYAPGDDRRHIHWRSTAKAGKLMVRQFLDTRRSHFAVVVDGDAGNYRDEDDFETAISAAASVVVRAIRDEQDVSVVAGEHSIFGEHGPRVLDTFSRAEFGRGGLTAGSAQAASQGGATIALLVTGSETTFDEVRRAASRFPSEVATVGLRIDPTKSTHVSETQGLPMLSLRSLAELAALLRGTFS